MSLPLIINKIQGWHPFHLCLRARARTHKFHVIKVHLHECVHPYTCSLIPQNSFKELVGHQQQFILSNS